LRVLPADRALGDESRCHETPCSKERTGSALA
jgi:hypothetical protein